MARSIGTLCLPLLVLALLSGRARANSPASQPGARETFRVFDALLFAGAPRVTFAELGMDRVYVTGSEFWKGRHPEYDMSQPYEPACRFLARKVARLDQILVIDIEHWEVDVRKAPEAEVAANLAKLAQIVDWVRDERPELKVGFYGLMPLDDFWTPVRYMTARARPDDPWHRAKLPEFEAAYAKWVQANDLVREALAPKVDYSFPSLYAFYEDREGWLHYARAAVEQAGRADRPVYPFLMMEFHDSNAELAGKLLPPEYWSLQLNTCRELADGVVIWGGWRRRWDDDAPWWTATREFLAAPQRGRGAP